MKTILYVFPAFFIAAVMLLPIQAENRDSAFVSGIIIPAELQSGARTCPICGLTTIDADIKPGAALMASRLLTPKLKASPGCNFAFSGDGENNPESKTAALSEIVASAKSNGATLALTPVLLRYHELVGNKIAATSPASVVFHLHLVGLNDSKIKWSFVYNETQRPLSENLLEIKKLYNRKFKWVSAQELLSEGIAKAIKSLPSCDEVAK